MATKTIVAGDTATAEQDAETNLLDVQTVRRGQDDGVADACVHQILQAREGGDVLRNAELGAKGRDAAWVAPADRRPGERTFGPCRHEGPGVLRSGVPGAHER